jgi:GT2 family glycosyltransferase
MTTTPRAHIVVLNWTNWGDTLQCLESVLRSDYDNFQIIISDNAIDPEPMRRLRAWASGELEPPPVAAPLRHLMDGPRRSPSPVVEIDRASAERGGTGESRAARLLIIRNGENLGFAGGNNVAFRHLLAAKADGLVCLLNNDTVVARDWLSRLVETIEGDAEIGAVGAMLWEYDNPDLVESAGGGRLRPWQGMPNETTATRQRRGTPEVIPRRLDFLSGACMLMRLETLRQVGFLDERYFMYCEDVDFSLRIREAGLRIALAADAEMWHKNGAAMRHRSARHDYYLTRNALLVVHKFFPLMLPAALAFSLYRCALPKVVRGEWGRLRAVRGAYKDFFSFIGGRSSALGAGTSAPELAS